MLGLVTENRVKFDIPIPEDIKQIYDTFKKHNYKLYIVGGAVRDSLLGKPIKDYDLATDALPDVVEELMQEINFKTIGTGKAFGVINVFTGKGEYEIATFRYEETNKDLDTFRKYLQSLNNGKYELFIDNLMK